MGAILEGLSQLREEQLFFLVVVVGVVVCGIVAIVHLVMKHIQRMAMIEQGMHPDKPNEADHKDEV